MDEPLGVTSEHLFAGQGCNQQPVVGDQILQQRPPGRLLPPVNLGLASLAIILSPQFWHRNACFRRFPQYSANRPRVPCGEPP